MGNNDNQGIKNAVIKNSVPSDGGGPGGVKKDSSMSKGSQIGDKELGNATKAGGRVGRRLALQRHARKGGG